MLSAIALTSPPTDHRRAVAPRLNARETVHWLDNLFRQRGSHAYTGHGVTQDQHARQCATLARDRGEPETLVAAALLHDLGHMLTPMNEDIADMHRDQQHEATGAAWLASRFGQAVSEPVRLHGHAKRYLCTVDESYLASLSDTSVCSLSLQGGPLNRAECDAFEQMPWCWEAVRLRRLDDRAKVVGGGALEFVEFTSLLSSLAARHENARRRDPAANK